MKTSLLLLFIIGIFSQLLTAQNLKFEDLYEVDITLSPPVVAGTKVIYPATGGAVKGKINGKILPVGGDFGTFVNATTFKLDVRAVIATDDGATIYVTYGGFVHTDEATMQLLATGKGANVDPSKYYFRINPIFETTSPAYDWLNHTVAVGIGKLTATGVSYKVFAIE